MNSQQYFAAAMGATVAQITRALDASSTWETVPHRTWWRRWLGQTEQKRIVDHFAYMRRLGELRRLEPGPHGWEKAVQRKGKSGWREAVTKRGPE